MNMIMYSILLTLYLTGYSSVRYIEQKSAAESNHLTENVIYYDLNCMYYHKGIIKGAYFHGDCKTRRMHSSAFTVPEFRF